MTLEQEPDPLRRMPIRHTAKLRAEIGGVLRAARLKRGQTLEAVAQQTRISKRYLEALENDQFEEFPAVVYLRGFLKGYCEHLEVDFEELWRRLNAPAATPESATESAAAPAAPPPRGAQRPTSRERAPGARDRALGEEVPPPHAVGSATTAHASVETAAHGGGGGTGAIVLACVLVLGLGVYLFKERGVNAHPPAAPAAPRALQPLPRAVEPRLTIRLNHDAWLSVSVDGQSMFEGRAPRGAAQEWTPSRLVILRTTEPSALELSLNGVAVPLGAPGPEGEYRLEVP